LSIHRPNDARKPADAKPVKRDRIYTFPNLLTVSRIAACPFLGWSILDGNFALATSLLVYAGLTDLVRVFLFFSLFLFF
jgi:cardiolipin synthase (CMP-forming)